MSSTIWRKRGNDDFITAKRSSIDKIDNFKKALDCYMHAVNLAESDIEYSSAAKNCGMTYVEMISHIGSEPTNNEARIKLFARALEFTSKAIHRGRHCQSAEWLTRLTVSYNRCVQNVLLFTETFPRLEQVQVYQAVIGDVVGDDTNKAQFCLKAAQILHDEAEVLLRGNKLKEASDLLKDAQKPLTRAKDLGECTSRLESAIEKLHLRIQTRLEFLKAESLLKEATDQRTTSNFHLDLLFCSIDTFTTTIEMAEEVQQLTVEAEAYSRLGHIYDKILHNASRAKVYFLKCFFITDAIVPRNVWDKAWHRDCMEALQRYQRQAVEEADNEDLRGRRQYHDTMREELRELREVSGQECIPTLLEFIPRRFPARREGLQPLDKAAISSMDKRDQRKYALKLARFYHKDQQPGNDNNWKFLCEEIMKAINKVLPELC